LILSPFPVTNQSVQAVNGCHQIIFFVPETENVKIYDFTKKII
jgi:hypothetical protein